MRLWCQLPARLEMENPAIISFLDILERGYGKVKREETKPVVKPLDKGLDVVNLTFYMGLRFLNDREILKNAVRAEKEGYDGIVITCYLDPALQAARQMVDIPVVGIAESAMHVAAIMGHKFATITSDHCYVKEIEENIEKYRMEKNSISHRPVRSLSLRLEEFMACFAGDYTPVLDDFRKVAQTCLDDGAESIIVGCGLLSCMLTENGVTDVDGVPVIDPLLIGLKFGEMMVDLKRSGLPFIGRVGLYSKAPDQNIREAMDYF